MYGFPIFIHTQMQRFHRQNHVVKLGINFTHVSGSFSQQWVGGQSRVLGLYVILLLFILFHAVIVMA